MNVRLALVAASVVALALLIWMRGGGAPQDAAVPERVDGEAAASSVALEAAEAIPASERDVVVPAGGAQPRPDAPAAEPDAGPTGTLLVRVTSLETGRPLERLVRVSRTSSVPVRSGQDRNRQTDPDGVTRFRVPAGIELELSVGSEWLPASVSRRVPALAPGELREVHVELPTGPDLSFCGRVVDGRDGTPIAGARVVAQVAGFDTQGFATDPEPHVLEVVERTETDAKGRFALTLPPRESWGIHLRVDADGFGPALVKPAPGHERREDEATIELGPAAALAGRLLGLEPGEEGRVVRVAADALGLSQGGDVVPFDPTWRAQVGPDGSWSIAGLPAGVDLQLEVLVNRSTELAKGPLVLAPGQEAFLELDLRARATVRGRAWVEETGEPLRDHELWLVPARDTRSLQLSRVDHVDPRAATTHTDDDGRFRFEDVFAGSWIVGPAPRATYAERTPDDVVPVGTRFDVTLAESEVAVELRVHAGLFVRGRVVDAAGTPLEHVFVLASGENFSGGAYTTAGGAFRIGPLLPGTYRLRGATRDGSTSQGRETVTAEPGAEDVLLVLDRGATLAGVVLDARTGAPVPDVQLDLDRGDGLPRRAWSQAEGFRFEGLPADTYTLRARIGRLAGSLSIAALAPGEERTGLRLLLEPAAILVVRADGLTETARVELHQNGARFDGFLLAPGRERETALPPGPVTVVWTSESAGETVEGRRRHVALTAGEETVVELTP